MRCEIHTTMISRAPWTVILPSFVGSPYFRSSPSHVFEAHYIHVRSHDSRMRTRNQKMEIGGPSVFQILQGLFNFQLCLSKLYYSSL